MKHQPAEYYLNSAWNSAEAAAKTVKATVETLESLDWDAGKKRSATIEICDPNGVAYYVIDILRVRPSVTTEDKK